MTRLRHREIRGHLGATQRLERVIAAPMPIVVAAACGRLLVCACTVSALLLGAGARPAFAGVLLPERGGSPNADRIASLYTVVLVLAAIVFVVVTAATVYALVRYRAARSPVAAQIRGHTRLEIAWTIVATALIVFLSVFSITKLNAIERPDRAAADPAAVAKAGVGDGGDDALSIKVIGSRYVWKYEYPNGAYAYHELVAPVGVTVELEISSVDVAHSWWIPKLGGKFDALPGYVNHTWFRLLKGGVYRGQCAELCGRNHADMLAQVRGVAPAAYTQWVTQQRRETTANDPLPRADRQRPLAR